FRRVLFRSGASVLAAPSSPVPMSSLGGGASPLSTPVPNWPSSASSLGGGGLPASPNDAVDEPPISWLGDGASDAAPTEPPCTLASPRRMVIVISISVPITYL